MKVSTLVVGSMCFCSVCLSSYAEAGTAMKHEGACTGTLEDGAAVQLVYYSNFNGCQNQSRSAVSFTSGLEGLFTGKRSFKGERDIYTFSVNEKQNRRELLRLTFANSTGQTEGTLRYLDEADGKRKSVPLQCEIRDYEYAECAQ